MGCFDTVGEHEARMRRTTMIVNVLIASVADQFSAGECTRNAHTYDAFLPGSDPLDTQQKLKKDEWPLASLEHHRRAFFVSISQEMAESRLVPVSEAAKLALHSGESHERRFRSEYPTERLAIVSKASAGTASERACGVILALPEERTMSYLTISGLLVTLGRKRAHADVVQQILVGHSDFVLWRFFPATNHFSYKEPVA